MTKDQRAMLNKVLDRHEPLDLIQLSDTLVSIDEQLDGGFDPSDSEALLLVAHMLRSKALEQDLVIKMRDATPEELEAVDEYIKNMSTATVIDFWDEEQTPNKNEFMNKPCVSARVCEHDKLEAFNKLRSKILSYRSTIGRAASEDELKIEGMKEAYTDCIGMIDEYISEMEDVND